MRNRFVFASFVVSALVVACSGSAPSDLFSTDGTSDAGTATPVDAATPTRDATTVDPVVDAGDPPIDANVRDATVEPPKAGITCGAATCAIGETCCANGERAPFTHVCKADKGACANESIVIQCDSAADCATAAGNARICCGERVTENGRVTYRDVTCKSSCGGTSVRFCDPGNPAASCGAQGRCGPSTILPGYNTCQ